MRKAMKIAGDICVYTNHNVTMELLPKPAAVDDKIPATADTGAVTGSGSLNSSSAPGIEAAKAGGADASVGGGSAPFKASTLAGLKFY